MLCKPVHSIKQESGTSVAFEKETEVNADFPLNIDFISVMLSSYEMLVSVLSNNAVNVSAPPPLMLPISVGISSGVMLALPPVLARIASAMSERVELSITYLLKSSPPLRQSVR